MKGLTRILVIVGIVLALQLGQASRALADPCLGCEDPCAGCLWIPNDIAWE